MARVNIDNTGNIFPDSKTTIADLAQFTFADYKSDSMSIYFAEGLLQRDRRFEVASWEYEAAVGLTATFKDGSILFVGAYRFSEDEDENPRIPGTDNCRRFDLPCAA